VNLNRRNLTKGQQAYAMIYPNTDKKGSETKPFSKVRLSEARAVWRHSRDLAESVIQGSISLDAALEQAEVARQQASSTEAKLKRLNRSASDLAAPN
jgi:hypothetical protein